MTKEIQYTETGFNELDGRNLAEDLRKILPDGTEDITVEIIPHGNVNRNVKISTKQGKYFCKIAPLWYHGSLHREAWALGKVEEVGCPVPKTLAYLSEDNTVIPGHEILLLNFVEGELLAGVEDKEQYFGQIIDIYNAVHSIPTKRFGWLNKDFEGNNDTWLSFLMQIENEKVISRLGRDWSENLVFVRREIETCLGSAEASKIDAESGNLLYGDFNYSNFIVDKRRRLVALDLQNCFSGDQLYDVGMAVANDSRFGGRLQYFKGFNPDNFQKGEKVIYLYALRHLLCMLTFFSSKNNEEMILFVKRRFAEVMSLYRALPR